MLLNMFKILSIYLLSFSYIFLGDVGSGKRSILLFYTGDSLYSNCLLVNENNESVASVSVASIPQTELVIALLFYCFSVVYFTIIIIIICVKCS